MLLPASCLLMWKGHPREPGGKPVALAATKRKEKLSQDQCNHTTESELIRFQRRRLCGHGVHQFVGPAAKDEKQKGRESEDRIGGDQASILGPAEVNGVGPRHYGIQGEGSSGKSGLGIDVRDRTEGCARPPATAVRLWDTRISLVNPWTSMGKVPSSPGG